MSVFEIDKLLHQAGDAAGWQRIVNDEGALKDRDLTDAEKKALLDGDLPTLDRMGVNSWLLLRLAAWNGLAARLTAILGER